MKKILLLARLITALSSCGGGGGGGGSSQTGSATPVPTPSQPGSNTNNQAQNPNLPNNIGQTQNNPSQSGSNNNNSSTSQVPKNTDFTGRGVSVAVLDSDFLSSDVHTNQLYNKRSYIDEIIDREFKDRFIKEPIVTNAAYLSKSNHGILVASILGGNSGTGATGAKIHGVSVSQGSGFYLDIDKYLDLQNKGVRIYSHSFGTQQTLGEFNFNNFREPFRIYLRKLGETIALS